MTLQDVELIERPDGVAEIRLGEVVALVQEHPQRAERVRDHARRLRERGMNGGAARVEAERQHDRWQYILPNGESYSHPTRAGALHMARKYFVEAGIVLLPFDHSHLAAPDRAHAHDLTQARAALSVPLAGDFVQLPKQRIPTPRICGFSGITAGAFALSYGGSFSVPSKAAQVGPHWCSYSGALEWRPDYITERLTDTGRTLRGRFWFQSVDPTRGGDGIGVALPCRVWTFDGAAT